MHSATYVGRKGLMENEPIRQGVILLLTLALVLAAEASHTEVEPCGAQAGEPAAELPFSKAYQEAMAAPLDELYPGPLAELAQYMSVFDSGKARSLLEMADRVMSGGWQQREEQRMREMGIPLLGSNFTDESGFYIGLAEKAAPIDRQLAKKFLAKAQDVNEHKSPADELLVAEAKAGSLILEGRKKEAIREAVTFCRRVRRISFSSGGCALVWSSEGRMANMLLSLDPKVAVEFSSHFTKGSYIGTLIRAAEIVAREKPQLRLEYYRRAGSAALRIKNEALRDKTLRDSAIVIAEEDAHEALKLAKKIRSSGNRAGAARECLSRLAKEDLDEAIRLAAEGRTPDETRDIMDGIARAAIERDPKLLTRVLPFMDNAHRRGYALTEAAGELAERGDMEGAMGIVRMIEPAVVRAKGLAKVAGVIADRDKERALALLQEGFELALSADEQGYVIRELCKQTALVDRAQAVKCFQEALEDAFARAEKEGGREKYYRIVEWLATLNASAAAAALKKVPEFRVGDSVTWNDVLSANALPEIATVDPDMVARALTRMRKDKARNSEKHVDNVAGEVAVKVGEESEKLGEMFLTLISDEKERAKSRTKMMKKRIEKQIVADPARAAEFLKALETEKGEGINERSLLRDAVLQIARTDRKTAIAFAKRVDDDLIRDECFYSLCYESRENFNEAESIIALIKDPTRRVSSWMRIGKEIARQLPRWGPFFN